MSNTTPEQATDALGLVDRAHQRATATVGLPRWYWWAMAGGWVALGVVAEFAPPWAAIVATITFGAAHAAVASRLLDGRRPSAHVRLARNVADRRIPLLVIGILLCAVALTVGLALALQAEGLKHPALWAGVFVAAVIGFGGPELLRGARRVVGA